VVMPRIFSNLGLLSWLSHNPLVYSAPGSITDFGAMASNLFVLWRRASTPRRRKP
jgi:hypothetical protein